MQTHKQSLIEVGVSTGLAFLLAMGAAAIVYPAFGFPVTHGQNFWITLIFTVISLIRGYIFRRFFNWLHSSR